MHELNAQMIYDIFLFWIESYFNIRNNNSVFIYLIK